MRNQDHYFFADKSTEKVYIMMDDRLEALFKNETEYTIIDK